MWTEIHAYDAALESWGWPRANDRNSRQFIVDRNSSNEPVAQPVPISDLETRSMLNFYDFYDIVNSNDWKGIVCTCFSHVTYGCCGHSVSIFRKVGGILTGESRACEPSLGFRQKKGKVRSQPAPITLPVITEFIPHAASHNPGRRHVETAHAVDDSVNIVGEASSSVSTQTDQPSLVIEQAVADPPPHSHQARQAPQVAVQSSAQSTGSAGRPKRTQSLSVYRR